MDKLNIPEPVKVFITSTKFINGVFFLVFCLLMTLIISFQNFLFQQVVENGISKKDITLTNKPILKKLILVSINLPFYVLKILL